MLGRCSSIDVPVGVARRMFPGASCDDFEQDAEAVVRIHSREICSVRTQLSEKRGWIRIDALSNNRDSEPWNRRPFGRNSDMETIGVLGCGSTKGVELMRGPQVCGELLQKLRWRVHPIETIEFGRESYACKPPQPFVPLRFGQPGEIG